MQVGLKHGDLILLGGNWGNFRHVADCGHTLPLDLLLVGQQRFLLLFQLQLGFLLFVAKRTIIKW